MQIKLQLIIFLRLCQFFTGPKDASIPEEVYLTPFSVLCIGYL